MVVVDFLDVGNIETDVQAECILERWTSLTILTMNGGKRQEARGKRQEARGKRQEGRGKRQEARGKRQEARGKMQSNGQKQYNAKFCEQEFF